ncbi:hypothetical protein COCCADRAFT_106284, partial [Bipolaris zeicola 26-R-13]
TSACASLYSGAAVQPPRINHLIFKEMSRFEKPICVPNSHLLQHRIPNRGR